MVAADDAAIARGARVPRIYPGSGSRTGGTEDAPSELDVGGGEAGDPEPAVAVAEGDALGWLATQVAAWCTA